MKKMIMALVMCASGLVLAHDEGHGPKLSDTGKFGGIVSAVVLKADAKKGAKVALIFKTILQVPDEELNVIVSIVPRNGISIERLYALFLTVSICPER